MRTTVEIDDQLLREAKSVAAASGRSLTRLVEDALREMLARRREGVARQRVVLRTFKGQGVRPGIDLDDSAGLLDMMAPPDASA